MSGERAATAAPGDGGQSPIEQPAALPAAPAVSDAGGGSDNGNGAPATPAPGAGRDWRNDRIDQLTASNYSYRQRIADIQAQLEEAKAARAAASPAATAAPAPAAAAASGPAFEELVQKAAAERAAAADFTRRCDEVALAGRTQFPDFDARINNIRGLVDPHDPQSVGAYNNFLSAALETGKAAGVLHSLGSDMNEAARLLSLSPLKMAVEMERLAARQDPAAQPPSGAPRPIAPVGSHGAQRTDIAPDDATPLSADGRSAADSLPIDTWMARRNKQVEARGLR